MNNGFLFLCVSTGIMSFINLIFTCVAISDNEDYAGFLVAVEIILVLTFLTSGFLGFKG